MNFIKKMFAPKEVKAALISLHDIERKCSNVAFQKPVKVVESVILSNQRKFVLAIKEQGVSPHHKVCSMLENVAGDYLESGRPDLFIYRGVLSPQGQELLRAYDTLLDEMKETDYISEAEAAKQKNDIRACIEQVG